MNEKSFEPPVNLPEPALKSSPEVPALQETSNEAIESIAVEQDASNAPTGLAPAPFTSSLVPSSHDLPADDVNQASPASTASPQIADDSDLIEKEWVVKAKEIVARTKDDPYAQNKEMSKVKAEYLIKRYNKELKLNND
jgi:hypothetical protein